MKKAIRILIFLFVVLVFAAVTLWFIGGRAYEITSEAFVEAPASDVFRHLIEPDLAKQWMDGLADVVPIEGEKHAVGATATIIIEEEGDRYEMTEEILAFESNRQFKVAIRSTMFDVVNDYRLTPTETGTELTIDMTLNHKGFFRLFAPFTGSAIQEKLDMDFTRLKQLVETSYNGPG